MLIQPYLWMRVYDWKILVSEWNKYLFYCSSTLFAVVVWILNAEIGYYNTGLIIQYIFFVMASTYLYNQRYGVKESICLAFLTVYLNSYYWELPLHIAEYIEGYRYLAQLKQLWRLFPLLFFIPRGMITKEDTAPLLGGTLISVGFMAYRETGHGRDLPLQALHHPVNRLVCLAILIYVIIKETPRDDG